MRETAVESRPLRKVREKDWAPRKLRALAERPRRALRDRTGTCHRLQYRSGSLRSHHKYMLLRTLIIGGREIVIGALGQPMDHAFDRLHAAYFGNVPLPWEEFTAAALQYFETNAGAPTAHDAYFTAFTVIWQSIMDAGRLDHAEHVWKRALEPA